MRLPLAQERVVLIDFGRSSLGTDEGRRITTSEITEHFPAWEKNGLHADVMHFAAMLVLVQPTTISKSLAVPKAGFWESEALKPDAPPCARALLRLIKAALQCEGESRTDMFVEYTTCRDAPTSDCAHKAIHRLRKEGGGCAGALPTRWLNDRELVTGFTTLDVGSNHIIYADLES